MESSEATRQASNKFVDVDMLEDVQIEENAQLHEQEAEKSGAKKRKVVTRSIQWNYFEKVTITELGEDGKPIIGEDGEPVTTLKGKCKRCGQLIAADSRSGTNGMKNHNISCSRKYEAAAKQTLLNYTPNIDGVGMGSLTSWKFDQKDIRSVLCEMIIMDELPFLFVEREGFKKFVARLCPQFQIPSRQTIREDCVKLFVERKESLKLFFQKKGMGRVSITTDSWTAVNNTNFICVTAHCIGKDWVLHKKIINFCKIVSHKGDDIGASIVSSLREWGLQNVLCCTMDNAYANDGAVKYVKSYLNTWKTNVLDGRYLHMRCAAHILNLVVLDGLEEIGLSVRRVREAVKWMKASPARYEQFNVYCQAVQINCKKKLCLDVPTRWNSTYLMLESAQPFEAVFTFFLNLHPAYVDDLNHRKYNDNPIGPPVELDWINVRKTIEYLKKFYELTLLVSGTSYATSHLFFLEMCDVFDLISELESSNDDEVSSMAKKMRTKLGKYWLEEADLNPKMNRILYIAALLDPRQKMKHVEKCLHTVYGVDRGNTLVREVTDSANALFDFYKKYLAPTSAQKSNPSPVEARSHGRSDRRGACSLLRLHSNDDDVDDTDTSEIALYFTEKQYRMARDEVDDFDILQWWMKNSPRFPIMSEMARDILAIPVSSVASEAAFSMGGRVLSPYRSSLTPKMVEALICAADWLRSSANDKKDEEGVPEEELEKEFDMVVSTLGAATRGTVETA